MSAMHNQLRLLLDMNHPQTRHFIADVYEVCPQHPNF